MPSFTVRDVPLAVRVVLARRVIARAPGYSLSVWVRGWGGPLLALALLATVSIAVIAQVDEDVTADGDAPVAYLFGGSAGSSVGSADSSFRLPA